MNNYTITHCHTQLSSGTTNIDSITTYEDYILHAKSLGMKAIAFTEHGNVFSWVKKKLTCEEHGIKYIHAMEAYITKSLDSKVRDNYHCCLYALNHDGVKELNKLSSISFNKEHKYYAPRITFSELLSTSNNIAISTACIGSILGGNDNELKDRYISFLAANKERCFLEVGHHNTESQKEYNKYIYSLHKQYDIPMIAGTDTHALNKTHIKGRKILQSAKNIFFENEKGWDLSFKTYEELIAAFIEQKTLPYDAFMKAIENTNKLADMVSEFELDYSYKYPKLWKNPMTTIMEKINQGIERRGIRKFANYQEYLDRIDHEMKAYVHNGAIDFMLLMEDVISYCISVNIFVGYGRGSCNGSIIAWLLGITEMDSIKHNLNFERFMNTSRVSLSDIDTDFPPSRVEEVKDYIFSKTGLYCADIITFNTVAIKGAIRDVGRALNIPLEEINEIAKNIEGNEQEYREEYPQLFEYVDIINGALVSVGSHPCFLPETLVLTSNGYKEIQDIKKGDKVLTHRNNFKEVFDVMVNQTNDICIVNPSCTLPIPTTPNHPFYTKKRTSTKYKSYDAPTWVKAEDIHKGDLIGMPINNKSVMVRNLYDLPYSSNDLWWIVGRFLGDGWVTEMNRKNYRGTKKDYAEKYLVICCSKHKAEKEEICNVLDRLNFAYSVQERKTVYRIYIRNAMLLDYLKTYGKYAYGKFIPNEVMDMPVHLLESLIDGYISADGHYIKEQGKYTFKTVSKQLALGLIQCIAKVYKKHCNVCVKMAGQDIIEGRTVNRKEKYEITYYKDKRKNARSFYEDGYIWMTCKSIDMQNTKNTSVYNLAIYDDNSYTVNNVSVHNCGCCVSPYDLEAEIGTFTTSTSKYPITQINMKEVDLLNFVKLDLLRLDSIELINDACELAGIERLTPDNVDDDDAQVWESIRNDTTQIFQWESPMAGTYIKKLLSTSTIEKFKKINPNLKKMDLLSIGNSAIRPAGASYREELNEGKFRDSGSPVLNAFLSNTYSFLVFQEQIISFLNMYCGYTMGEADVVRRGFAKKSGTDEHIPRIKAGFIKTMTEQYGQTESEAEQTIVAFIRVIEDASNYLFSLNHSQPYSYIGYIAGYLRYYYPLEFLTAAFNINKDKEDKTNKLTEYALARGMSIKNPQFRYSKGDYFFSKETNSIYKGIGSIKYMNSKIGDALYALKDNQYDTFLDLLNDIKKINCNSKQLGILVKIGFFNEFGSIKKLESIIKIFDKLYGKKSISKLKIEELGLTHIDLSQYATDISEKTGKTTNTWKLFDSLGMIKELSTHISNQEHSIGQLLEYQCEIMGYITYINKDIDKKYCVITGVEGKTTRKLSVYSLNNGKTVTLKVNKRDFNKKPLEEGMMIYARAMRKDFKAIPLEKREDGSVVKWGKDTQVIEWWLDEYTIIEDFEI